MESRRYPSAIWPINEATSGIAFSWLLHLRWGAVFCQAALILIAYFYLEIALPIIFVSVIILFEALSNLYFIILAKREKVIPEWLFGQIMFFDIILLTALLYYTGGPMNPFTFLYLVHIVIGAILMRAYWSWSLTIFTILCYSSFFLVDPHILEQLPFMLPGGFIGGTDVQETCHPAILEYTMLSDHMKLHLKGMLLAFAITAVFIVFFVGKIQKALEAHQQVLIRLDEERARSEKLSSLATLSAGTTHELSTPLATIAVAAGEMMHQLQHGEIDQGLMDDVQLIRDQVKTCKDILYQMAADSGEHLGEALEISAVGHLVSYAIKEFSQEDRARIQVENQAADIAVRIPLRTFVRSVKGLIKNGLEASEKTSPVQLKCFSDRNFLYLQVKDQGCGMDKEIMARVCEPFFTTKEQGKGLGLGLFLARNVAEQFGGELSVSSEKSHGTTITLSFAMKHIAV
ncbi:ATP-binding protein [Thermodesulfobacteriota bacterium]